MNRIKFLSTVFIIIFMAGLIGCGGGDSGSSDDSNGGSTGNITLSGTLGTGSIGSDLGCQ